MNVSSRETHCTAACCSGPREVNLTLSVYVKILSVLHCQSFVQQYFLSVGNSPLKPKEPLPLPWAPPPTELALAHPPFSSPFSRHQSPKSLVRKALRRKQRTSHGGVEEDRPSVLEGKGGGGAGGRGTGQGQGLPFAALPQAPCTGIRWGKERGCPCTPGASAPTGKEEGKEVIGRATGSANEKHRCFGSLC